VQQPAPERLKATSTLDEIAERVRQLDPLWQALADDSRLPDRELSDPHGSALAVAPMAQTIHHADVHRAEYQTILGAHGISAPALDRWGQRGRCGLHARTQRLRRRRVAALRAPSTWTAGSVPGRQASRSAQRSRPISATSAARPWAAYRLPNPPPTTTTCG
jgi:hypothetical protein